MWVIDVYNSSFSLFCHGDSGGPIYYYPNSDSTQVNAAGLAKGIYTSGGQNCSNLGAISVVASAISVVGQGLTVTTG